MSMLCTICARGGSKGVKNKNIRDVNGLPLIAYSVLQALESKMFEHVVISTDSEEIAEAAVRYGAECFFRREPELASDTAGKLGVIRDAFVRSEEYYGKKFDFLTDLDATSPLRTAEDIRLAFQQFIKDDNCNLVTAMPSRRSPYFNLVEFDENKRLRLSKPLPEKIVRRQDAPKTYDMNASIYIFKRDTILNEKELFLEKTGLYVMPEERSIDIDSELDLEFVAFLLRKRG